MSGFAARVGDQVAHPLPPKLVGTLGSPNVMIKSQFAWRGISPAQVSALMNAIKDAEIAIKMAKADENKVRLYQAKKLGETLAGFAVTSDIHQCTTVVPLPIHGPGVVVDGSSTVLINGQPACRTGDTILEANVLANVPPLTNKIVTGCLTVLIGG